MIFVVLLSIKYLLKFRIIIEIKVKSYKRNQKFPS